VVNNTGEGESTRALKGFDEGDRFGIKDIPALIGNDERKRC